MENTKTAKITDWAVKNPEIAGGVLGGALYAGSAGLGHLVGTVDKRIERAAAHKGIKKGTKEYNEFRSRMLKLNYGLSTALGVGLGALAGNQFRQVSQYYNSDNFRKAYEEAFRRNGGRSYYGARSQGMGFHNLNKAKELLKIDGSEVTKHDVKRKFQRMAMKFHPDRGGNEEMMKKINEAWKTIQDSGWFNKLAFWQGFMKQASQPSRRDILEVLKKHEERETPEQEAQESQHEQEIEEKAGIHEKNAKKKPEQEVVMYHGEYAGPSKEHCQVVNRVAKEHGITPRIVNVEDEKGLAEATKAGIRGVPHVSFRRNGKETHSYTGSLPETHVRAHFKRHGKEGGLV